LLLQRKAGKNPVNPENASSGLRAKLRKIALKPYDPPPLKDSHAANGWRLEESF